MSDFLIFDGGDLEIRARKDGGKMLSGKFPHGKIATIRDRGKVRKERIGKRAFGWQIKEFEKLQGELVHHDRRDGGPRPARKFCLEQLERRNVHVLSGHSYSKPLGSLRDGNARFIDADDSLRFEVDLAQMRKICLQLHARCCKRTQNRNRRRFVSRLQGSAHGQQSRNAQELVPEPGNPGVMIRQVNEAVLYLR